MQPRIVMVSGGARGLGASIVARCLADGHRVSVGARDPDAVRTRFSEAGDALRAYHFDALRPETVDNWLAGTKSELGSPDTLHEFENTVPNSSICLNVFGSVGESPSLIR